MPCVANPHSAFDGDGGSRDRSHKRVRHHVGANVVMSTDYRVGVADQTRGLFGQVMGYVAGTAGLFALGSYLGATSGTAGRSSSSSSRSAA